MTSGDRFVFPETVFGAVGSCELKEQCPTNQERQEKVGSNMTYFCTLKGAYRFPHAHALEAAMDKLVEHVIEHQVFFSLVPPGFSREGLSLLIDQSNHLPASELERIYEAIEQLVSFAVEGAFVATFEGVTDCDSLSLTPSSRKRLPQQLPERHGRWDFLYALEHGLTKQVDELLRKGLDPNLSFYPSHPLMPTAYPLYCVAQGGHPSLVEMLIEYGARFPDAASATHPLCVVKDVPTLDALLAAGASLKIKDNEGYTPLDWACLRRHQELAHVLLGRGVSFGVGEAPGVELLWRSIVAMGDLTLFDALAQNTPPTQALTEALLLEAMRVGNSVLVERLYEGSGCWPKETIAALCEGGLTQTLEAHLADWCQSHPEASLATHPAPRSWLRAAAAGGQEETVRWLHQQGVPYGADAPEPLSHALLGAFEGRHLGLFVSIAKQRPQEFEGERGKEWLTLAWQEGQYDMALVMLSLGASLPEEETLLGLRDESLQWTRLREAASLSLDELSGRVEEICLFEQALKEPGCVERRQLLQTHKELLWAYWKPDFGRLLSLLLQALEEQSDDECLVLLESLQPTHPLDVPLALMQPLIEALQTHTESSLVGLRRNAFLLLGHLRSFCDWQEARYYGRKLRHPRILSMLQEAIQVEPLPSSVRAVIADHLKSVEEGERRASALALCRGLVFEQDEAAITHVLDALHEYHTQNEWTEALVASVRGELETMLASGRRSKQLGAAMILIHFAPDVVMPALFASLEGEPEQTRQVIELLQHVQTPEVVEALFRVFRETDDFRVHYESMKALCEMGELAVPLLPALLDMAKPEEPSLLFRGSAIAVIGSLGEAAHAHLPLLLEYALEPPQPGEDEDRRFELRDAAWQAIGWLGLRHKAHAARIIEALLQHIPMIDEVEDFHIAAAARALILNADGYTFPTVEQKAEVSELLGRVFGANSQVYDEYAYETLNEWSVHGPWGQEAATAAWALYESDEAVSWLRRQGLSLLNACVADGLTLDKELLRPLKALALEGEGTFQDEAKMLLLRTYSSDEDDGNDEVFALSEELVPSLLRWLADEVDPTIPARYLASVGAILLHRLRGMRGALGERFVRLCERVRAQWEEVDEVLDARILSFTRGSCSFEVGFPPHRRYILGELHKVQEAKEALMLFLQQDRLAHFQQGAEEVLF